jgi:pyridoxine 4-dehydrogenase
VRTSDRRVVLGLYRSGHDRDLLEAAAELGITGLDTAFNYRGFDSHRTLAGIGGDLLDRFEVTTKVGFFPNGHSLDPVRLRAAVHKSAEDLGRAPDTVLLHNPENDPSGLPAAANALRELVAEGLCQRWGISTWDPRPLLSVFTAHQVEPDMLMTRAGITVPVGVLDAASLAAAACSAAECRGMAPFGGNPDDDAWSRFDACLLLRPGQSCTPLQARFVAAFALPSVVAIAVGSSRPAHLKELLEATELDTDTAAVERYRALLTQRANVAGTATSRSAA